MGVLDGVDELASESIGTFLGLGTYILEINEVTQGVSKRDGATCPVIIVSGVVDEVLKEGEHQPGEFVKWILKMDGRDIKKKNAKNFFASLLQITQNVEREGEKVLSGKLNVQGRKVVSQGTEITTRAGNLFTKVVWGEANDKLLEKVKAARSKTPLAAAVESDAFTLDDVPF